MKHNIKITLLLLAMFVVTQFIGLFVIYQYAPKEILINGTIQNVSNTLPEWIQPQEKPSPQDSGIMIVFAFAIALALLLFLSKINAAWVLKGWFFIVVLLALSIAINAFVILGLSDNTLAISFIIALPFAYWKIFQRNFVVHNLTELLIYPGIAALFVPMLNILTIVILLILISIYDIYAVWHAGFMQKMARYQIEHLKIFSGFFVPYTSKKHRAQIQLVKAAKTEAKKKKLSKNIKVSVALLGGGDIVFPIITAGVVLMFWGFIPSLFVIAGALTGLTYLLFFAEKGKFYPAMPYITAGIFVGMIIGYLLQFAH